MHGITRFNANGQTFDIPETAAPDFLKDAPGARRTRRFTAGGNTYDIPDGEAEAFLKDAPDAVETRTIGYRGADGTDKTVDVPLADLPTFLRERYNRDDVFAHDRERTRRDIEAKLPKPDESPLWAGVKAFGEGLVRSVTDAENLWRETYGDGFANDYLKAANANANKIVNGILGLPADMSSTLSMATGGANTAVGRWLKNDAQATRQTLEEAFPSSISNALGHEDWGAIAGDKIGDISATIIKFAAGDKDPTKLFNSFVVSTAAADSYAQTYDQAIAHGRSVEDANYLANGSATWNALLTMFMMRAFKGEAQAVRRDLGTGAKAILKREATQAAKTGNVMGVQGAGNAAINANVDGRTVTPEEVGRGYLEGFKEGVIFHGMNALGAQISEYGHNAARRAEWVDSFRKHIIDSNTDREMYLRTPMGDPMRAVCESVQNGVLPDRKAFVSAGIPKELCRTEAQRREIASKFMETMQLSTDARTAEAVRRVYEMTPDLWPNAYARRQEEIASNTVPTDRRLWNGRKVIAERVNLDDGKFGYDFYNDAGDGTRQLITTSDEPLLGDAYRDATNDLMDFYGMERPKQTGKTVTEPLLRDKLAEEVKQEQTTVQETKNEEPTADRPQVVDEPVSGESAPAETGRRDEGVAPGDGADAASPRGAAEAVAAPETPAPSAEATLERGAQDALAAALEAVKPTAKKRPGKVAAKSEEPVAPTPDKKPAASESVAQEPSKTPDEPSAAEPAKVVDTKSGGIVSSLIGRHLAKKPDSYVSNVAEAARELDSSHEIVSIKSANLQYGILGLSVIERVNGKDVEEYYALDTTNGSIRKPSQNGLVEVWSPKSASNKSMPDPTAPSAPAKPQVLNLNAESIRRANDVSMNGASGDVLAKDAQAMYERGLKKLADTDGMTPEEKAQAAIEREQWKALVESAYNDMIARRANWVSPAVAGPAKYNTRKWSKRQDAMIAAGNEWQGKMERFIENAGKRIREAATEQVQIDRIRAHGTDEAINGGDANAAAKIQAKIDNLRAEQVRMKAMNAWFRQHKTMVGFEGLSDEIAKKLDERIADNYLGMQIPAPDYLLKNNGANIRRLEKRLDEVKANAAKAAEATPTESAWGTVTENAEANRLQVAFSGGKPSEDVTALMRHNGFKWSPKNGVWQRQLTDNARRTMERIKPEIDKLFGVDADKAAKAAAFNAPAFEVGANGEKVAIGPQAEATSAPKTDGRARMTNEATTNTSDNSYKYHHKIGEEIINTNLDLAEYKKASNEESHLSNARYELSKYMSRNKTEKAADALRRFEKYVGIMSKRNPQIAKDYADEIADAKNILSRINDARGKADWDALSKASKEWSEHVKRNNKQTPNSILDALRGNAHQTPSAASAPKEAQPTAPTAAKRAEAASRAPEAKPVEMTAKDAAALLGADAYDKATLTEKLRQWERHPTEANAPHREAAKLMLGKLEGAQAAPVAKAAAFNAPAFEVGANGEKVAIGPKAETSKNEQWEIQYNKNGLKRTEYFTSREDAEKALVGKRDGRLRDVTNRKYDFDRKGKKEKVVGESGIIEYTLSDEGKWISPDEYKKYAESKYGDASSEQPAAEPAPAAPKRRPGKKTEKAVQVDEKKSQVVKKNEIPDTTPLSNAIIEAKTALKNNEAKEFEVKVGTTTIKFLSNEDGIAAAERMLRKLSHVKDWSKKERPQVIKEPTDYRIRTGKSVESAHDQMDDFVAEKKDYRNEFKKPFVQNGYEYATDGKILFRAKSSDDAKNTDGAPNAEVLFKSRGEPILTFDVDVAKIKIPLNQTVIATENTEGRGVELWRGKNGELMFRATTKDDPLRDFGSEDVVSFYGKSLKDADYIGTFNYNYLDKLFSAFAKMGDGSVTVEWRGPTDALYMRGKSAEALLMPRSMSKTNADTLVQIKGGRRRFSDNQLHDDFIANETARLINNRMNKVRASAKAEEMWTEHQNALKEKLAKGVEDPLLSRRPDEAVDPAKLDDPAFREWSAKRGTKADDAEALARDRVAYDLDQAMDAAKRTGNWLGLKVVRETNADALPEGAKAQLVGVNENGEQVYKTNGKFSRYDGNVITKWFRDTIRSDFANGKKITFVKPDGTKYEAGFTRDDIKKISGGDKSSDEIGFRTKRDMLGEHDTANLLDGMTFVGTETERGKIIGPHRGVTSWDRYEKNVVIDGKPTTVTALVRNKNGEHFVYDISFREKGTPHRKGRASADGVQPPLLDRDSASIDPVALGREARGGLESAPTGEGRSAGRGDSALLDVTGDIVQNLPNGVKALKGANGNVVGWYDPATKEVHLKPGADAKTVAHEVGWHATYDWAKANHPALAKTMEQYAANAPEALKAEIKKLYGRDLTPAELVEEIGAGRFEREHGRKLQKLLADRANRTWYRKVWDGIKDAYKAVLTKLGFNRVDLDEALQDKTPEQAMDFLASAMARGKALGKMRPGKVREGARPMAAITPVGPVGPVDPQTKLNKKELLVRSIKDSDIALRKMDELDGRYANGDYADNSIHLAKKLLPGDRERAIHRRDFYEQSIAKIMREHKITVNDIDDYLLSVAVPERNARLAAKGITDGAGLTDADAAALDANLRATLTSAQYAQVQRCAHILWAMQQEGMAARIASGRVAQDVYDTWNAAEPHHIPMRTDRSELADIDAHNYSTGGYKRNDFMTAKGRRTRASSPTAFIFDEYTDARLSSLDNDLRVKLADFVRQHPEIGKIAGANRADNGYVILNGESGSGLKIEPKREQYGHRPQKGEDPNLILFKEGGILKAIELNGDFGTQIADAITDRQIWDFSGWGPEVPLLKFGAKDATGKRHFVQKTEKRAIGDWLKSASSAYASTATRWSPTFMARNFVKDQIELNLQNLAEYGFVDGAKAAKNQLVNSIGSVREINRYLGSKEFDTSTEEGKWLKRYVEAGGLIGGAGSEGYTEFKRRFDGFSQATEKGKARKIVDAIVRANEISEMMNRLANFRTACENGMGDRQAALKSRNDSVDFNSFGRAKWMNTVWNFSNSVTGGTMRQAYYLSRKHGRKLAASLFAYGFAEGLAEVLMNMDDDERETEGLPSETSMSEYQRANAAYVRRGDKFYRLPIHAGIFSTFKYAGNGAARMMFGKLNWEEYANALYGEARDTLKHFTGTGDVAGGDSTIGTLNIGNRGGKFAPLPNLTQSFSPSMLQGPVQRYDYGPNSPIEAGTGLTFAGTPLRDRSFNPNEPQAYNGREMTAAPYKWAAQALNAMSGGNEHRKGNWDMAPEDIKVITESLGKNVLKDAANAVNLLSLLTKEGRADFRVGNIPFVGDFVRNVPENDTRYYAAMDRLSADQNEYKNLQGAEKQAFGRSHKLINRTSHPTYDKKGRITGFAEDKTEAERLVDQIKDERNLVRSGKIEESNPVYDRRGKIVRFRHDKVEHAYTPDEREQAERTRRKKQAKFIRLTREDDASK